MDRVMDQDARRRCAGFALVVEHPLQRDIDRGVQVGVGQDHQGVLAAQLHRRVRHVVRGALQHPLPGHRRPGERDPLHLRMRGQGRAGRNAGNGVQDTRRQHLVREFDQPQHGERRLLARLDHHGVARRQRRRAFLREMDRRPVERQDRGDHAVGLVNHPGLDGALVDDLAMQRVGQPGVVVVPGVAVGQVEAQGITAWLTHLAGLEFGQLLHMRADFRGHQAQQPAPLTRGQLTPWAVGAPRLGHRPVHQVAAAADHPRELPSGGRLHDRERLGAPRFDERTADERAPYLTPGITRRLRAGRGCGHQDSNR